MYTFWFLEENVNKSVKNKKIYRSSKNSDLEYEYKGHLFDIINNSSNGSKESTDAQRNDSILHDQSIKSFQNIIVVQVDYFPLPDACKKQPNPKMVG